MNRVFYENIKEDNGSALIMTLLILASILTVALGAASLIVPGLQMSKVQEDSTKAYFAAEAGAERSLWEVRKNTEFDLPFNDWDNLFSEPLGNGSAYSVDYATSSPIVTFTSKGSYSNTNRSVAVGFRTRVEPAGQECDLTCISPQICSAAFIDNASVTAGDCCDEAKTCYVCDAGYFWDGNNCELIAPIVSVTDCQKLQDIENDLAGNYQLDDDINCTGFDYGDGGGFKPIGEGGNVFTGKLFGNNNKIINLTVNRPGDENVGVFGDIDGAAIADIDLVGIDIYGAAYSGGLAGSANNSDITNINVDGNIDSGDGDDYTGGLIGTIFGTNITNCSFVGFMDLNANSDYRGGLVGEARQSSIVNSYSNTEIGGRHQVGGLVGLADNVTITDCYAKGEVRGSGYGIGGLIGESSNGSNVTNSFAEGSVYGEEDDYVGGLIGLIRSGGNIEQSYALGDVDSHGDYVGGLVGDNREGVISNCYAISNVTGDEYVGGLVGESSGTTIINSYAVGEINANDYLGGLIGYSYSSTITNAYWNLDLYSDDNGFGEGKTTAEMISGATPPNEENYNTWTFLPTDNADWKLDFLGAGYYPCLSWQNNVTCPTP